MKRKSILSLEDKALDRRIKIAGTQYDRRRKLTDHQLKRIKQLSDDGLTNEELAVMYNVDPRTIRYHLDDNYRRSRIWQASSTLRLPGDNELLSTEQKLQMRIEQFRDRVRYKRYLILHRKLKV